MPSPTQETTILDALRESRREIHEEALEQEKGLCELWARECDMDSQIARLQGYPLDAEFHRARAAELRDTTPETTAARHRAYVRMQAASYLRLGTVPASNDMDREEIEAAMDEMRGGVRQ